MTDPIDLLTNAANVLESAAQRLDITDGWPEQNQPRLYALGLRKLRDHLKAGRTCTGWVSGASMEWGTVTVKIDGDPEGVAGVVLGEKARATLHLHPYLERP